MKSCGDRDLCNDLKIGHHGREFVRDTGEHIAHGDWPEILLRTYHRECFSRSQHEDNTGYTVPCVFPKSSDGSLSSWSWTGGVGFSKQVCTWGTALRLEGILGVI
jgi:hypothetical protein